MRGVPLKRKSITLVGIFCSVVAPVKRKLLSSSYGRKTFLLAWSAEELETLKPVHTMASNFLGCHSFFLGSVIVA